MTENSHESTQIDTNFCRIKNPGFRQSFAKERRLRRLDKRLYTLGGYKAPLGFAIVSITDFRSVSARPLLFLRRAARATPVLLRRARVVQAVQRQRPRVRWRPVFYFS
jgi:hypothetical protein